VSYCILIVDDNPINLKLARSVLEIEGYHVDAAVDAEDALGYLEKTSPDLILMDIALPGMDGLSLTRKLKADPRWRSIPIIALTAFAMLTDEKQALDAGCDGYLTKPIDTRQLPLTVIAHLRKSGEP
jgi:CheY-like chemotaxis protein